MKREEKIAESFLKERFGEKPAYEPLGKNTTPDFSIGRSAFEVRRLNQIHTDNGTPEPLERAAYSLETAIRGQLSRIPFLSEMGSFFWGLRFERPLRSAVGKIAREIAREARGHYLSGTRFKQTVTAHGVEVELIPASNSHSKAFLSGYTVDGDSGGWVNQLRLTNIEFALKEKIEKTERVARKFDRWFLVLVDSITAGISWDDDLKLASLELGHFHGVAVLNSDGSLAMEWPCNSIC
jgi:hypothetical protein